MFYSLISSYQRALVKLLDIDLPKLPHDYLIAQCNNCFTFFESMEDLLQPVKDSSPLCTEEEIEAHYSQRNILQFF